VWETGAWRVRHQFTNEPGPGALMMAFSPDARLLALRKSASEIQLLDPVDGRELAVLPGKEVWPIGFSPNGTQFLVGEISGRVNLWDLPRLREELAKLKLDWPLAAQAK